MANQLGGAAFGFLSLREVKLRSIASLGSAMTVFARSEVNAYELLSFFRVTGSAADITKRIARSKIGGKDSWLLEGYVPFRKEEDYVYLMSQRSDSVPIDSH